MPEKPILFNTEMVRALLDGRKTQTRRVIRNLCLEAPYAEEDEGRLFLADDDGEFHSAETFSNVQRGDRLWVRETWAYNRDRWLYKADYPDSEDRSWARWRPSIHMPREAARIFLRVTDVWAERLQNIDAWDILAEGVTCDTDAAWCDIVRLKFRELWDRTIKPADRDRYGWSANPWVWVIQFKKAEGR